LIDGFMLCELVERIDIAILVQHQCPIGLMAPIDKDAEQNESGEEISFAADRAPGMPIAVLAEIECRQGDHCSQHDDMPIALLIDSVKTRAGYQIEKHQDDEQELDIFQIMDIEE
jgi:hypothetical protein